MSSCPNSDLGNPSPFLSGDGDHESNLFKTMPGQRVAPDLPQSAQIRGHKVRRSPFTNQALQQTAVLVILLVVLVVLLAFLVGVTAVSWDPRSFCHGVGGSARGSRWRYRWCFGSPVVCARGGGSARGCGQPKNRRYRHPTNSTKESTGRVGASGAILPVAAISEPVFLFFSSFLTFFLIIERGSARRVLSARRSANAS